MLRAESLLRQSRLGCLALAMASAWACAPPCPAASNARWPASPDAEVVGPPDAGPQKIVADLYLDGTVSMQGFTRAADGGYAQFLHDLEAALDSTWQASEIHVFKFGERERELTRQEFLNAVSPQFYAEPGMSATTDIDKVFEHAQPGHLTVVVTDLFEDEGDINAITKVLKDRFLSVNDAVGIIAVPSPFDGTVYDARVPPFAYRTTNDPASYRPFYAVAVGTTTDVGRLITAVSRDGRAPLFVLVTPFPSMTVQVSIRGERNLAEVAAGAADYRFNDDNAPAQLAVTVESAARPGAPPIDLQALRLVVEEEGAGGVERLADSVKLVRVSGTSDRFSALVEAPAPAAGCGHEYHATLRIDDADAYRLPKWAEQWSSADPAPGHEPNRTFNLDRFISTLTRSAATTHPPILAHFRFRLTRR